MLDPFLSPALIGMLARHDEVNQRTNTEQVVAENRMRSHIVVRGQISHVRHRQRRPAMNRAATEIADFQIELGVQQEVSGDDVAVNDAERVQDLHGFRGVFCPPQTQVQRYIAIRCSLHKRRQVPILEELHTQTGSRWIPVDDFGDARVVGVVFMDPPVDMDLGLHFSAPDLHLIARARHERRLDDGAGWQPFDDRRGSPVHELAFRDAEDFGV